MSSKASMYSNVSNDFNIGTPFDLSQYLQLIKYIVRLKKKSAFAPCKREIIDD